MFIYTWRVLSIHANPYQALTDQQYQRKKSESNKEHYKGKSESDQKRAQQSRYTIFCWSPLRRPLPPPINVKVAWPPHEPRNVQLKSFLMEI